MPYFKKTIYIKLLEFFIVSALSLFFLSKMLFYFTSAINLKPVWLDHWYMCYTLEHQVTRILGLNPGGIWEGGFYYPFHTVSLLFDEPLWGISLFITPVWMFTKNIFPIFFFGGIPALFLSWIFTYYFVKHLGVAKIYAFYAGAVFCLSGINLILMGQCCFWIFFIIPLIGIVTLKIFSTSRLYWGVFWGILFGYLAWSSAHIFVMGGLFLCLLILWNLLFNNHSKKILLTLLIAFILSGIIAGIVLVSMYLIQKKFGFFRGYEQPYWYSSNWANLIYRAWPAVPFNPIAKTHLWEYLKTNAKGEVNIGMSIFLLFSALIIVIKRLKESMPLHNKANQHSKYVFIIVIVIAILFAFLNMQSLTAKCMQQKIPLPELASGITYLFYIIAGIIVYILRHRIIAAIKHLDFFLLLAAFLFGFLCFGPYYLTGNKLTIALPVAFLQYHVPGFSGIQATARWGLILSFTVSIATAIFLSKYVTNRRLRFCAVIFMLISLLEISPGFQIPNFKNLSPYEWTPRATDIFLKNIPDNGAVLELASYPVRRDQQLVSDNSLGYVLFSSLYHKKPLVTGYSSHNPHVIMKYIFYPKDEAMSLKTIDTLRKFGAKYWVFHIEDWPLEDIRLLKNSIGMLKQIAELDNGKTLIYEDLAPKISVTYYDVK